VRRLIFMRHGQYDEALTGSLTPLGRRQAARTARALRHLPVDLIWHSTLLRAEETARIVAEQQPGVRVRRTAALCEVIPTALPPALKIVVERGRVTVDRKRADRAFRMLFRPSKKARTELVVCHGNLIRYLVCCALGIDKKLWTRLDATHCGLTEFRVIGPGRFGPKPMVRVVRYNDAGHLPPRMRTESLAARAFRTKTRSD
jgi:serine/threonine-protein phosphatase PGAM5